MSKTYLQGIKCKNYPSGYRIVLVIILCLILSSCEWVDDRFFNECTFEEIQDIKCIDQGFYMCWTRLKYVKLIDCENIDEFIFGEYFTWNEHTQYIIDYDLNLYEYLECCYE